MMVAEKIEAPTNEVHRTPLWPNGFCPMHVYTDAQCGSWCRETRLAFGQNARDFEAYWRDVGMMHRWQRKVA